MPYYEDGVLYPDKGTETPNQVRKSMLRIAMIALGDMLKNTLIGNTKLANINKGIFLAAIVLYVQLA